ncbi:hypothetical protein GALL_419560 [mine drainage metagenome]|uniref:Uncharacterized protein n=1 Tax=mine drainage metagenome TaxID=410659 RepID=A0A1J5QK38_9ZZZZ
MSDDARADTSAAEWSADAAADSETVMGLLAEHVPLALLADLAAPDGPVSQEILESEGLPADAWWEAADEAPSAHGGSD